MRTTCLLIALICLVATANLAQAAIYKWVGENGTIVFRDTPPPEGTDTTVVKPEPLSDIKYDSGLTPAEEARSKVEREAASSNSHESSTVRKLRKDFPEVELYVTSWCGYCSKAKAYFRNNGVPFKLYDVEKDSRASKRHRELNPGGGVPVVVIGGRTIRGFSPEAYGQLLGL